MTVKHTLVSLDMRVFALCSLMELHRSEAVGTPSAQECPLRHEQGGLKAPPTERARQA